MLGLGVACSHGSTLFRPPESWPRALARLSPGIIELFEGAKAERDSLETMKALHARVHDCYAALRAQVGAYRPDVIVMMGDDQGDMFDMSNNPTFSIYTGDEPIWGRTGYDWDKPVAERRMVNFQNHVELSRHLLKELVKRGFDISNCGRFEPVGHPEMGVSHMVARIVPELDSSGQIPIVMVLMNEYYPPLPTGKRCVQLGRAIGEILDARPERIAICASGGLSHYLGEFNQGFIDTPLDLAIIDYLKANDLEALAQLFAFDSHNLRSGTGEIRAWLSVAAAMNRPFELLDYIPIHSALTGTAFGAWPAQEARAG